MLLRDLLDEYASAHEYGLRQSTIGFHKAAIGSWEKFAKRRIQVDDLNSAEINRWLDWTKLNRSPDTFRTARGAILTLWRFAHDQGIVQTEPRAIRKVRIRRGSPTAWTPEELTRLIQAVADNGPWSRERHPSGIPQGIWWESIIRTAYDTGMRLGDILEAGPDQVSVIRTGGVLRYVASKTGDEFFRSLTPKTLYYVQACIGANRHKQTLIWPLWATRDAFYRHFRSIVKRAAIRKGTFRWIRRTAVTWADIASPGLGQQLAGHKSERVTAASYRDVSQIGRALPAPPSLDSAVEMQRSRS